MENSSPANVKGAILSVKETERERKRMERIITKQAFAEIIKTSRPTLNKWIAQNRNGIAQYVTEAGIDAAIFEAEPWSRYKPAEDEPNADADPADLQAAAEEMTRELAEVKSARDQLNAKIVSLNNEIELLKAQIEFKEQEIQFQRDAAEKFRQMAADFKQMADQAQRLQMAQLAALPAPRKHRTPKEFFTDIFGRKKEDETEAEI